MRNAPIRGSSGNFTAGFLAESCAWFLGGRVCLGSCLRFIAPHSSCEWTMNCRVFSSADGGHSGANSGMDTRAPEPPGARSPPSMRYNFRNFQPYQPPDIPAFSTPHPNLSEIQSTPPASSEPPKNARRTLLAEARPMSDEFRRWPAHQSPVSTAQMLRNTTRSWWSCRYSGPGLRSGRI